MDYEEYIPKIKIFFLAFVSWVLAYNLFYLIFFNEDYAAVFSDSLITMSGKIAIIFLIPFKGL